MSMPSSPRVPLSTDARRRTPRVKDKRRALRDFYGLGQSQSTGPVDHDPILDSHDFNVSQYIDILNQKNDIKGLLKLENAMIRDIRILDGERKALIYDNYGRMINATTTIQKMTTELKPMCRDTFEPLLKSITELSTSLKEKDETENDESLTDAKDPDDALRQWVRNGPKRITKLLDSYSNDAAKEELKDVLESLEILEDSEMQTIKLETDGLKQRLKIEPLQTQEKPDNAA